MDDDSLSRALCLAVLLLAVALVVMAQTLGRFRRQLRRLRRRLRHRRSPTIQHTTLISKSYTPAATSVTPTPPAPSFYLVEHTAFVDSVYGSDVTGTVERPDLPFVTIQAAVDAAATARQSDGNQWQVQIRPGVYVENIVLSPGVDLLGIQADASFGVFVIGTLSWADATEVEGSISAEGLDVSSLNAPVVYLGVDSTTTVRRLKFTQCQLSSLWTESVANFVTSVDLHESTGAGPLASGSSVTFEACSIFTVINQLLDVTEQSIVRSEVASLNVLHSQPGFVIQNSTGGSMLSPITLVSIRGAAAANRAVAAEFLANQFTVVFNVPNATFEPALNALFQLDGATGSPALPTTLTSQADIFNVTTDLSEAKTIALDLVLVHMIGTPNPLVSFMQAPRLSFMDSTAVTVPGILEPLRAESINADLSCAAYFRGMIVHGIEVFFADPGLDGTFTYLITDVVTDSTLMGQCYEGTVRELTDGTVSVEAGDAVLVARTSGMSITFPAPATSLGRFFFIKNATGGTVTLTDVESDYEMPAGSGAIVVSTGSAFVIVADWIDPRP
jgi:hypothetical protein